MGKVMCYLANFVILKPMILKAVLWDWDNTLFNSWDTITLGWNAVLRHFGMQEHTLNEVKAFAHRSCRDAFPAFFGERSQEATEVFYDTVYKNRVVELMPGARQILTMLHENGIAMGVVSNKQSHTLKEEIEKCELGHFFQTAIGSGDVPHDKPAPDGINLALQNMNQSPLGAWYVGDTPVDVEAARSAGCISVVVHTRESCEPHQPEHFCATLGDLQRLLESVLRQQDKHAHAARS